ncbi:DUF6776 family protein [Sessilibacter sp. MAH2]
MTKLKSTKSKQLVVVEHQPWRGRILLLVAVVAIVLASFGGYWFGGYVLRQEVAELTVAKQALESKLASAEDKVNELRQQSANLRLGSEIDKKASEDVRNQVVELRDKIATLEADISFYRGIMSPKGNQQGLTIGQVDFIATQIPRHYQYRMVIQQLASNHNLISGALTVTVVGRQGGQARQFPLKDLSEQIDDEDIKLRFKYFQNIEGELVLPEGFEPERIELMAKSSGKNGQLVEKKFGWLVQET